jgi:transketolase
VTLTSVGDRADVVVDGSFRLAAGLPRREMVRELQRAATWIRRRSLRMVVSAGMGHVGGDMSATDILATLILAVLNVDPRDPDAPERDRLVMSKGHSSGSLYATLAAAGFIEDALLDGYMQPLSPLNGHPDRRKVPGVEASTGPLGHGLPIAVGMALSAKLDRSRRRTFVLTGDGELQEGSNWEALMASSQFGLEGLTVIVDRNRLQQGAPVADTNDLEPLADKARAFGLSVTEVDGHDHGRLLDLFGSTPIEPGRPTFVIAHTHKGHPISFMRDQVGWHHRVPTEEELAAALAELGEP